MRGLGLFNSRSDKAYLSCRSCAPLTLPNAIAGGAASAPWRVASARWAPLLEPRIANMKCVSGADASGDSECAGRALGSVPRDNADRNQPPGSLHTTSLRAQSVP